MNEAIEKHDKSYINQLHENSKGWITKATKNPDFKQWHYRFRDLILEDLEGNNTYISVNTFYKTYRRIEYLKELQAAFIDLDTYNTEFNKNQIIMNLQENFYNKSIPIPSLTIDSGRGLTLMWLINKVPYKALPLWNAIQEYLYEQLKEFGADKKALDCTRVLRVVGSINTKSNTRVEVIDSYDYVYDLREIQSEFLPELEPKKKKKGRPKKTVFVHRERSLYHARIQDITKLCELREYDLRGHRELILFLYRYYLCYFLNDTEKALNDTLELNAMFRPPLPQNEAVSTTRSAERVYENKNKDYKYKNDTLIELLDISEIEQQQMVTIIGKEEYKRRKNIRDKKYQKKKYDKQLKKEGKTRKTVEIAERRAKIKSLIDQGFKQSNIIKQLDISKMTYIRDRNYLKKKGLL